jgi:hypothetical protein
MQLSAEQLTQLRQWATDGESLASIQKHLEKDLKVRVTYMELRFLLDDYGIELVNPKPAPVPEKKAAPEAPVAGVPETAGSDAKAPAQEAELAGGVTVDLDAINKPGAVISGSVTFSDGVKAKWYLDQTGRLGLDGVEKTYRPSAQDVQDFQAELQKILQKKGY